MTMDSTIMEASHDSRKLLRNISVKLDDNGNAVLDQMEENEAHQQRVSNLLLNAKMNSCVAFRLFTRAGLAFRTLLNREQDTASGHPIFSIRTIVAGDTNARLLRLEQRHVCAPCYTAHGNEFNFHPVLHDYYAQAWMAYNALYEMYGALTWPSAMHDDKGQWTHRAFKNEHAELFERFPYEQVRLFYDSTRNKYRVTMGFGNDGELFTRRETALKAFRDTANFICRVSADKQLINMHANNA